MNCRRDPDVKFKNNREAKRDVCHVHLCRKPHEVTYLAESSRPEFAPEGDLRFCDECHKELLDAWYNELPKLEEKTDGPAGP